MSGRFLGGEGRAGPRSMWPLANLFSSSALVGPTHHSTCVYGEPCGVWSKTMGFNMNSIPSSAPCLLQQVVSLL